MKQQLSLTDLVAQIEANETKKLDMIADTRKITMLDNGSLDLEDVGNFKVNDWTHKQIGERLGIPAKYYNLLLTEARDLLATNVNRWFAERPEQRLVRTLDGVTRAFLSNRYKVVEHKQLALSILPIIMEIPGIEFESCAITDTKMYIKATTKSLQAEITEGDIVQAGIVISNSEVGAGAIRVEPLIYRLVCTNGMILEDGAYRASHLGKQNGAIGEVVELQQDTIEAGAKKIALECRDFANAIMDPKKFQERVLKMRETTKREIQGDPVKAIEIVSNKLKLNDTESSSVLRNLVKDHDLSQWGVLNAVTKMSQDDHTSYDRATEIEAAGSKILNLSDKEWNEIAKAA